MTFSYTAYFEDENAGIDKNVYFTSIQLTGGADMDKYILASTTGTGHADITPRTLNLYGFAATSKTYDGTTSVEGTRITSYNVCYTKLLRAGTWYYRALVKSGVCSEAYSSEFAVTVNKANLTVTASYNFV